MDSSERRTILRLTERISSLLKGDPPEPVGPPDTESPELRDLVDQADKLFVQFGQAHDFISALAEGKLDSEAPARNLLVSPFKQLHSVLRHLIWQTEQIAKGRLDQQVDFLGDFSQSFNAMLASMREKKRMQETIRESERLLSDVFAGIQDGLVVIDREFTILRANSPIRRRVGEGTDVVGKKCFDIFWKRSAPCKACPGHRAIETGGRGQSLTRETLGCRDSSAWIERHSFPMVDGESGEITGFILYARDVTDRHNAAEQIKNSLREKEALMREIHHRVKNNLQVVTNLMELQANYVSEETFTRVFRDTEARISAMARVHEKLCLSDSLAEIKINEYVRDVLEELMAFYPRNDARIALESDIEEICFDADTTMQCGLIITELVSNSLKHAYPAGGEGVIGVSLRAVAEDDYELIVGDDGVGLPADTDSAATRSLGLDLVHAFARKLRGEVRIDRSCGAVFRITFRARRTE